MAILRASTCGIFNTWPLGDSAVQQNQSRVIPIKTPAGATFLTHLSKVRPQSYGSLASAVVVAQPMHATCRCTIGEFGLAAMTTPPSHRRRSESQRRPPVRRLRPTGVDPVHARSGQRDMTPPTTSPPRRQDLPTASGPRTPSGRMSRLCGPSCDNEYGEVIPAMVTCEVQQQPGPGRTSVTR